MNHPGEILLVDDTPENLRVLSDLLRSQGYTVRVAPSGALALRSVRASRPDLILLDIRMPEMDGFETCRQLRDDPAMIGLPILFLSASEAVADRVASFEVGGQDFIAKPFEAAEVLARVATHLHLARARRELDLINDRLSQQVVSEERLRLAAEATAEDRRARLELTLSAANLGTWEVAAEDGTVTFDARARALLGLPPGHRPDWRAFLRLIRDPTQEPITQRWERAKRQQSLYDREGWWTPPGEPHQRLRIRLRGRPLPGNGEQPGDMVGVIWDITDEHVLRERLAERERMESIGRLAGGVAHDFNNLLAVIVGELDILDLDESMPLQAKPHLANMELAANNSIELIRELLSFARRRETVRTVIDAGELVRRTAHLAMRSLGPAVTTSVSVPDQPVWILGNAAQLENALLNLCINARDAMPNGGTLSITAQVREVEDALCRTSLQRFSGTWLVISIRDDGCGIPEALMSRTFEPFFSTKDEGVGTGLGLPSVSGCVASHDGHLTLDSTEGVGSCFAMHLPLCGPPTAAPPKPPITKRRAGNLLVLDDQETVREVIADGLRRLGWTVTAFGDPAAAIAAWKTQTPPFSAALIDLAMPGQNGASVFRALRRQDPEAQVVLMSGHTGGIDIDELLAEGLAGFIDKPIKLRPLADTLSNLIPEITP